MISRIKDIKNLIRRSTRVLEAEDRGKRNALFYDSDLMSLAFLLEILHQAAAF